MIKGFGINPWNCVPLLATIEFTKMNVDTHSDDMNINNATQNGFQPLIDHPLNWPQFSAFKDELEAKVKLRLGNDIDIFRSWFVSYNVGGHQNYHYHPDSDYSGVVCLMGSNINGIEFKEEGFFGLSMGDGLVFDSQLDHRSTTATVPRTILAFDIKKVKKS